MNRRWFLYIIECADGSLYTGITTDLVRRIARHNQGRAAKYTRARTPVKLVHSEICECESSARKREAEIKKLSCYDKLKIINKH
ncbi:MAG: GIY-YIG nuclease family protein [Candidatus Omnitrophota bacterium]